MSRALESLRSVAAGLPGSERELLHTCRLEAFGGESIGYRSVGETLRRAPLVIAAQPHCLGTAATLAVLDAATSGEATAFFADLYDGRIGRLWRIGPRNGLRLPRDPAISVPFDPLLSQLAPSVAIDEREFPELDKDALPAVRELVAGYCDNGFEATPDRSVRRTAFVVRAVSQDDNSALLLAVHELATGPVRRKSLRFAAVFCRFDGNSIVQSIASCDHSIDEAWMPRVWSPDSQTG